MHVAYYLCDECGHAWLTSWATWRTIKDMNDCCETCMNEQRFETVEPHYVSLAKVHTQ